MTEPIEFQAVIAKVQTLADSGIRVTLDLPETATLQMAQLAEVKRLFGVVLASLVPKMPEGVAEDERIYERLND